MNGYLYIKSYELEKDEFSEEVKTRFKIEIKYDDGQLIKTEFVLPGHNISFKDVFETTQKYFKGGLMLM